MIGSWTNCYNLWRKAGKGIAEAAKSADTWELRARAVDEQEKQSMKEFRSTRPECTCGWAGPGDIHTTACATTQSLKQEP